MKLLVTSDIHLTDNPRDVYRFGLFPWLHKQQLAHDTSAVLILGDLTDSKDRHSSLLVNNAIQGFRLLKPPVYILRGNHDGINPEQPFFKFLNEINGITFCTNFTLIQELRLAFIPHQTSQEDFNAAFEQVPKGYLALCHQTITGAISETGAQLTGLTIPINHKASAVYSGDIHVPHELNYLTYVGSPYHVHFGDVYKPRVLLLSANGNAYELGITEQNLYYPSPKKYHLQIRDVSEIPELRKGDQVKITLELTPAELVDWANHKKAIEDFCQAKGVKVYGIALKKIERRKRERLESKMTTSKSKMEYFSLYCNNEKLPKQIREAGQTFLETV